MADTGALFNATAVTTAGGHKNLLTTALAAAEWEVVATAIYNQPMLIKQAAGYYGTGPKMAINPKYCLVPRALQLTAMKILYPIPGECRQIYSENLQRGQPGDVITVPEWTDATDWAAVCDPAIAPAIYRRRTLRHHAGDLHRRRRAQPGRVHERRAPPQGPPLPGLLGERLPPAAQVERG